MTAPEHLRKLQDTMTDPAFEWTVSERIRIWDAFARALDLLETAEAERDAAKLQRVEPVPGREEEPSEDDYVTFENRTCAYCDVQVYGGPDGYYDVDGFERCGGGSPTSFHEVDAPVDAAFAGDYVHPERPAPPVKRLCFRCKGAPLAFAVVSPQGIAHIGENDGVTACGIDATGENWWWPL